MLPRLALVCCTLHLVACAAAQPKTDPPQVNQRPPGAYQGYDPEVQQSALTFNTQGKLASPTYQSQPRNPIPPKHKVAGPILCVEGTLLECDDRHVQWNGTQCCMIRPGACGDGTRVDCNEKNDRFMHWTGKGCCVENAQTCNPSDATACDAKGKHWTGKVCCE